MSWWQLDGQGALYRQLERALRLAILRGQLAEGSRLPASRSLAQQLGVSRNVVLAALERLVAEGFLHTRIGAGTYIASPLPETAPFSADSALPSTATPPRLAARATRSLSLWQPSARRRPLAAGTLDLRYGDVWLEPQFLRLWPRYLQQALQQLDGCYASSEGVPALRTAIAEHVRAQRGCHCQAEQVLITHGSQQALALIAEVLLEVGDWVALEEPGYRGAQQVFHAAGARLLPLPVDEQGLDPQLLSAQSALRLLYVTPSHQFPTGSVLPLPRRLALLEWARHHDAYIIEDDYDGEFRYDGRPLQALQGLDQHARTLYIGTFSKALYPGLRLGYLILPPSLIDAFRAAKQLSDRHCALLEQYALAQFIADGEFERHLRRLRRCYAERRATLLEGLAQLPGIRLQGSAAGLHLLAWLPQLPSADLPALLAHALQQGVALHAVDHCYLGSPPAHAGLLLGYAHLPSAALRLALTRLRAVWPVVLA